MNSGDQPPFLAFLQTGLDKGGFETDDVLAALLPLMRQTAAAHEQGLVAPLEGLAHLHVNDHHLSMDEAELLPPRHDPDRLRAMQRLNSGAVEVVGQSRRVAELDRSSLRITNLDVGHPGEPVTKPVFLQGYVAWEHALAHHDELTDIFSLGMLLASLACGLDFTDDADLQLFAGNRENLFALNARLNPVISSVIVQMTELDRHRRAQDLPSLIHRLESYRDQPADLDLNRIVGLKESGTKGRRKLIQAHLRERLFDVTRRNRLLYFKPTLQTLNLTIASVPLVLNFQSIRPEQLFTWHPALASEVSAGVPIALGKYLRFEDAPYIQPVLDKIIGQARRDRSEFGFAQLKLVLVFLRWHNFKEDAQERIHSPLLLLPVELTKKRGVRDHYVLEPTSSEAEVNPALRHSLKQFYDLDLPEIVDLSSTSLDEFHTQLQALIQASEPSVVLHKVDRPQIELIHERAQQRLDQYRRRIRLKTPESSGLGPMDYSYNRENLRPLGLQLFLKCIKPAPLPLREAVGAPPTPRLPNIMEPSANDKGGGAFLEVEHQTYALRQGEQEDVGNPYSWEFDLCAITLGNFNYRKMTLVRDYANLIESDITSEAFDRIFALDPSPPEEGPVRPLPLGEQHVVISCDTTQASAIARARTGQSYIIHGPPGTGKSQTITNLIADYVGQGKRVLFVCEKRAAIDVVFHRLRQTGLDQLCCLIHDSQTDKKSFIQNLKQTSEQWLANPEQDQEAEQNRVTAWRRMEQELSVLEGFSRSMCNTPEHAGIPLHVLLRRLVELRPHLVRLSPEQEEQMPAYARWREHGELAQRLAATLEELGEEPYLATHPFRWLGKSMVQSDRPIEALRERIERAEGLLDELEDAFVQSSLPEKQWLTIQEIEGLLAFLLRVQPLAERDLLRLLDPRSQESNEFTRRTSDFEKKVDAHIKAGAKTRHWRDKLPSEEAQAALFQARKFQGSFLAFFNPDWWRLRSVLKQRYDFSRHAVKPAWTKVLEDLLAEYQALDVVDTARNEARRDYQTEDLLHLSTEVGELHQTASAAPASIEATRQFLLVSPQARELVGRLTACGPRFAELLDRLSELLIDYSRYSFTELGEAIRDLREASDALPELLPALSELASCPDDFSRALRRFPLKAEQFEAAMACKSLSGTYRQDRGLNRFDGLGLTRCIQRLQQQYRVWLGHNAGAIRARVRRQFMENVNITSMAAAQLSPEQKAFKKHYAAGRRELEHEFGKTMRYKSIRELTGGNTGAVVRDLKPIWLMSPVSVSDTLPLDPGLFDVVIFDEASQIPMEEAVPAIYRAHQAIVVGDEMQLPPSSFFTAGRNEEDEFVVEEQGERIEVALDANSFLNQSVRSLPSTLLAWHYRSRYESLISFSNAAFYGGNLFTIPDQQLPEPGLTEFHVPENAQGEAGADALLSRSISFHFMERSVYENRRNSVEANYIAQLVCALLRRESKLSIGIVAFSEAQQTEIEEALDRLSSEDADFGARLEAELNREEDDQFCGLFVKNLENVQGDERDIIILSICYGYDTNRRMLMNFGPINQRGGEKRLNVIFSRAKQHMAVVSSIRHHDIRNDYNDGANALKNFLQYADALSRGDVNTARRVLENLNPLTRKSQALEVPRDAVLEELRTRLKARGYQVDANVGQSRFRCDLAVRHDSYSCYQLGILVDSERHYQSPDVVERYFVQPSVLQSFGWKVAMVLTKDWFDDPDAVLDRLERAMKSAQGPTAEIEEEPTPLSAPILSNTGDKMHTLEPPSEAPSPTQTIASQVTPAQSPAEQGPVRRFEFVEGNSRKFWEIAIGTSHLTVTFGRLGGRGQQQTKPFTEEAKARREGEKLIAEKLRKGYREVPTPMKELL